MILEERGLEGQVPFTFAVISDVHANAGALAACLARIEQIRAERGLAALPVYSLGDVLDSGPSPLETLRLVRSSCVLSLRGNHEDYVFDHHRNPRNARYLDPLWKFIPWTHARIPRADLEAFEKTTPPRASLGSRVHLFHASPESNARSPAFFALQDSVAVGERLALPPRFAGEVEALCFAGHNHYCGLHWDPQHAARHGGSLWVNAGSVGYPFVQGDPAHPQEPVATFVVAAVGPGPSGRLAVDVTFERVAHSGAALLHAFVASGALAACAPFSWAILAQCYFNEDVVYPFFRESRAQGWVQTDLPKQLERHLIESGYAERLAAAFTRHGVVTA